MYTSALSFGLRQFTEDDACSPDFIDSLGVYAQSTGPTCKTDTRQITYWLERFNSPESKLLTYGLYKNDKIIGFCLGFYFYDEQLLVLDHMAIAEEHRSHGAFFQFADLIQASLNDQKIEIRYAAIEVVTAETGHPMLLDPYPFIRLLKMSGFSVVKIKYQIPGSQKHDIKQATEGALLLYSLGSPKEISIEELEVIIAAIHKKLYIKWYKPFFGKKIDDYAKSLEELKKNIIPSLGRGKRIRLNGYAKNYPASVKNQEHIETPREKTRKKAFLFIILSFLAIAVVTVGLVLLANFSYLSFDWIIFTLLFCGLVFVLLSAIWMPNANKALEQFGKVLIKLFDIKE